MPVTTERGARARQSSEILALKKWLGNFPRHPGQLHGLNESDCEILRLKRNLFLASTIDSISEEITHGLYQDPYTMGWMAATASLSDLAAVGARPYGVLFSAQWSSSVPVGGKKRVARGFHDALKAAGTHLLGGDTGSSASTLLTSTGLGSTSVPPLSRVGLQPGDWIVATGLTGIGPALGFRLLLGKPESALPETLYRPKARVREGQSLLRLATAAMDTSDGLAQALITLQCLNEVGMELIWDSTMIAREALRFCRSQGLPPQLLWFGEHGDYQLVAGIPPSRLRKALVEIPDLKVLGKATPRKNRTDLLVFPKGKAWTAEPSWKVESFALDLAFRAPRAEASDMKGIESLFKRVLDYVLRVVPRGRESNAWS